MLTGQSAFTRLHGRGTYVTDPTTGLRLLRPHAVIRGQRSTMHTNRLRSARRGLSAATRDPGERRVVLLGASTIMGTYAADDAATRACSSSGAWRPPVTNARVINAGVAGLTVGNQATLLQRRMLAFEPDVLVWYPGPQRFQVPPATGARGPLRCAGRCRRCPPG